jgi:conflict system pore-forming effector with SLATT domain
LTPVTLPALYDAADKASLEGQNNYLRARGIQLASLVVAAIAGVVVVRVGAYDVAGFVGLAAFGVVLVVQFTVGWQAEQRAWYDGRAAAESIKHLAWRYAMRAEPFLDDAGVDARFTKTLTDTLHDVQHLKLASEGRDQITDWIRTTRSADLADRRTAYVTQRVEDQQDWYKKKADTAKRYGARWRRVLYVLGVIGAGAGLAKALALTELDGLGVAATGVTAATAWIATKQYEALEVSYGLAVQDLASVHSLESSIAPTDDAWSTYVNDAEDAISREHRMWRASRVGRTGSGR